MSASDLDQSLIQTESADFSANLNTDCTRTAGPEEQTSVH